MIFFHADPCALSLKVCDLCITSLLPYMLHV